MALCCASGLALSLGLMLVFVFPGIITSTVGVVVTAAGIMLAHDAIKEDS